MADTEFREGRDDRRERGGYRGNNKRRRDGKFPTLPLRTIVLFPISTCRLANLHTQMMATIITVATIAEVLSDAVMMTVRAVDMKSPRFLSSGDYC